MVKGYRWFRVDYGRVMHYVEVRSVPGYTGPRCFSVCKRVSYRREAGAWTGTMAEDDIPKCKECARREKAGTVGVAW